jgi:hypothetical protein
MINYNNKTFRSSESTGNSETNTETIFIYRQDGNIVTASYAGGNIISGHLVGLVDSTGRLDMRYHHINTDHIIMTGTCITTPELSESGKLILHEKWQWTSGDMSKGESKLEEI